MRKGEARGGREGREEEKEGGREVGNVEGESKGVFW